MIVALACAWACSGNPLLVKTEKLDAPTMSYEGKTKLSPELAARLPSRVAVLPFVNETESPAASDTVRKSFYNHFSAKNFEDVELPLVDQRLAAAGLTDPKAIENEDPKRLGELLHVDGLVMGHITDFDRIYAVVGALVNVGAKVRLIDARSGELVWEGQDVARLQEGDIPTSIVGALASAASAALNMRQVVLLRASDELFRGMVTGIPEPTVVGGGKAPRIVSVLHDSAGQVRKAGDVVHVVLTGDPGQHGSFSLRGVKDGIRMEEATAEPGRYEGTYTVLPGDGASAVVVSAALESASGVRAEWNDALGPFAIDTQPPPPPAELLATAGDGLARLAWKAPSSAPDLAGYRVYTSATPLGGFVPLADTELTELEAKGLANQQPVWLRVSAVDRAGNVSEPSAAVEVVPRPHGATEVSGPIAGVVKWWESGSPYHVRGDLVVPSGARLELEPGTAVEVEGGAIVVEGALAARGLAARGIRFRGGASGWKGLVLRGAESALAHVEVRDAEVGVSVVGVSPALSELRLTANGTGLVVEGPFAKSELRALTITANREDGAVVRDGAAPTLDSCTIESNGRHGLRVERASPTVRGSTIARNRGDGVLSDGMPVLDGNSFADNGGFDLRQSGPRIAVAKSWWGSPQPARVLARIAGPVAVASVLTAPPGEGEERDLVSAPRALTGRLAGEVLLVAADSPYEVRGEVVIPEGARVTIGAGVTLLYAGRGATLVVEGGALWAAGTAAAPVRFDSAERSVAPGDYRAAIEIRGAATEPTSIEHVVIRHAAYGLMVRAGAGEITHALIRDCLQSGVLVSGAAEPKITHSTITANAGTAGIEVEGQARPRIEANNIHANGWPIQSRSSQYVLAQGNWWGGEPDPTSFVGQVDFSGWLAGPVSDAPAPEPGGE